MAESLIAYTIPEKPNSRLQKYRLTEKGPSAPGDQIRLPVLIFSWRERPTVSLASTSHYDTEKSVADMKLVIRPS